MYFFKGIVTAMRILIAEDDLISRTIMKKIPFSHILGSAMLQLMVKAVNLFRIAMAEDRPQCC